VVEFSFVVFDVFSLEMISKSQQEAVEKNYRKKWV
jgi:hypothetical protein